MHISDHPEESAAWSAWQALARRHPDAVEGLQPQVVARDWVFTLIATATTSSPQAGCEKLRQAGYQCFLSQADFSTSPSESSDIPGTEQRPANEQEITPSAAEKPPSESLASASSLNDEASPPPAVKPPGLTAEHQAEPQAETQEAFEAAPQEEPEKKPQAEPQAEPTVEPITDPVDQPIAQPITPPIAQLATEQPGMQLALYHDRAMAEQGWQLLHERFPDLLGDLVPVYTLLYNYIALRAVTADAADRDRICTSLRQRGAECLPTEVAFSGNLAALPTPTQNHRPDSSDTDPAADDSPEVPQTDAEADTNALEHGAEDNGTGADGVNENRDENAEASKDKNLDNNLAPPETESQSAPSQPPPPEPPPPQPPERFGQGGATLDYPASPLGPDSIVISIPDRKLLYHAKDGAIYVWPVAVGRHWSYHIFGDTEITVKRPNPTWTPPPDMRKRNPRLPSRMGPGPRNPLGAYALNLGFPYIRIHGTDKPHSVGRAASSGCYRMHADAIKFLFQSVSVGTPVRVTAEPLAALMSRTAAR
ncbi:L,D-transpeptidase [Thiorhodovibrio frisius]|uniref:L,D-TPase catalytic domain-containing protein n=1 Tax=Thiorhodovibrio frisius TaxID=631362 RepID=H8Z5N8_9GAMM|nr:L,D-transpeptidase [Thiorhodovibrio frisius]EIC20608.1 hypothetical protein Thi970DRAFT_04262 [Thiorhodovibrio frisius]WPL21357.1 putative L,D-transpeptidase YnhG precursor [Thiorhodovibrio frisius]